MKKILFLIILALVIVAIFNDKNSAPAPESTSTTNTSTLYTKDTPVLINGYKDDTMEPFLTDDGSTLFFNSLNNGKTTSLYYAKRVTDTEFTFAGEVIGVNGNKPHLDGVASLDTKGNFYWISTRNYPTVIENLQTGTWDDGTVTDISPVQGDIYVSKPGWIMMDAEISKDGQDLYFVNADFSHGEAVPKSAALALAHKDGDAFIKDKASERIFATINAFNIVYAPSISKDGLSLIFTRLTEEPETQMYIAQRSSKNEPFGEPERLDLPGVLPEAATFAPNANGFYYHKKIGGTFQLFLAQ